MRRYLLTLLVLLLVGACGDREPTALRPPSGGMAANQRLLSETPVLPGARVVVMTEGDSPRGGRGAMTYLYFAAPDDDRAAIVSYFKSALGSGWSLAQESTHKTRSTAVFMQQDAYPSVTASAVSVADKPVPGNTLVVNALDAKALLAAQ
jgi:hypothetical protein